MIWRIIREATAREWAGDFAGLFGFVGMAVVFIYALPLLSMMIGD